MQKLDSIALSNWTTLTLVVSDSVWWWRDLEMGGFEWRLATVGIILLIAYTGYLISAIWYTKEQRLKREE